MTKNDKILNDLTRHLRDKILDNTSDYMDLCRTAELPYHHVCSELMVVFSHLAAGYATYQFKIDESDFIELMRIQFKRAQERDES